MSKHTPGPWQVVDADKAQSPWIIGDAEGGSIADCEPCGPWMSDQEANANARLIAAAPDMLAALRNVQKLISNGAMTGFNCHDGDWAERLFESQQVTSAAIRKAEGKS